MEISISSHVLDLDAGRPAAGMDIILSRLEEGTPVEIASAVTDADGRAGRWQVELQPGDVLQARFMTGPWYQARGEHCFYPEVVVSYQPTEAGHYHIPLLVNRHGYSTYRGS